MNALAVRLYDEWVVKCGGQVYLPQPFHTCKQGCKLKEIRGLKPPHFVCESSRAVHVCGEDCKYVDRENVCVLTGFVIRPNLVYNPTISKVDPRKRINEISCRLPTGRTGKRRRPAVPTLHKRLDESKACLRMIMFGADRIAVYHREVGRYNKEVLELVKRGFSAPVTFTEVHALAVQVKTRKDRLLCLPAPAFTEPELDALAERICRYADVFSAYNAELASLCANTEVFTACMISKLAVGSVVGGVTLITPEPPFILHAPDEIQFGEFDILCSNMAKMSRKMQEASITPNGAINLKMIFPTRS
jgi:hypothetical protein